MNTAANINEFRRLDKEVEATEAENEAKKWRMAELAAEAVAGGTSRVKYAQQVGRSDTHIGHLVRMWERWGSNPGKRPRFIDAYATARAKSDELVTRADQHRREEERRVPTQHDDRVEMAGRLLADPTVAKAVMPTVLAEPSKSQRFIEQAVSRKNAEERKRQVEEANRKRNATAAPLPAYLARMVVKLNEWAAALANIEPDLEALPAGRGREMLLDALRELDRQAQRCIARLQDEPAEDVVEGRVA